MFFEREKKKDRYIFVRQLQLLEKSAQTLTEDPYIHQGAKFNMVTRGTSKKPPPVIRNAKLK